MKKIPGIYQRNIMEEQTMSIGGNPEERMPGPEVQLQKEDLHLKIQEEQQKILTEALENAKSANRAKSIFLSNMSHDLRTPLNAIIGYCDIASKNLDNRELLESSLKQISTSGRYLLGIINDVLDMSRIEFGQIANSPEEVSLSELIENIRGVLNLDLAKKRQSLFVDLCAVRDDRVLCDRNHFARVLMNLLNNAIKFTPEGGMIAVKAEQLDAAEKGRAFYRFFVQDNGIGMSEEFQKNLFEPFEREKTSTVSGTAGTGLGMTITKNLLECMGGTISVHSEKGVGTEFTIEITFDLATVREEAVKEETGRLDGVRILLAEDNLLNSEIATFLLNALGAEVDPVTNGLEVLNRLETSPEDRYDVILMDVQMPFLDGYEATRCIRRMSSLKWSDIPIIAMTANAFESDRKASLEVGMNGHIAKPIDASELARTIREVLS